MDDLTTWLTKLHDQAPTTSSLYPAEDRPSEVAPTLRQDGGVPDSPNDDLPALEAFLASIERDATLQAALEADAPLPPSPTVSHAAANAPTTTLLNDPEIAARLALVKPWVPSDDDILPTINTKHRNTAKAAPPTTAVKSTKAPKAPKPPKVAKSKNDDNAGLVSAKPRIAEAKEPKRGRHHK